MAGDTAIEWTDKVWNFVTGCSRTSPGCDHCYAEEIAKRFAGTPAFPQGFSVTSHPERIDAPLHWRGPARIFVNSMSDFSHPGIPIDLLAQAYDVMSRAHWHRFLILTKRPRRMEHVLAACAVLGHTLTPWPLPNLWLGTSIESDRWTFRADYLRAAPAARRFLSLEPLLGPLPSLDLDGIDWVIVGGESGPHARPMEVEWVRDIRDDCRAAGVPFFFKQDSGRWPGRRGRFADADARPQERPRDLLVRP